jgi:hypothetical protein
MIDEENRRFPLNLFPRAAVRSLGCAIACVAFLAGCAPGFLDALARSADDPVVESPSVASFRVEDRIDVRWAPDPGADSYVLERAADAPEPVYEAVYEGAKVSWMDFRLSERGLYLYRLTKLRGSRSFGPSEPVLGVASSVSRDAHEPNDDETTATVLTYDRESNLYFYRSCGGQTVRDEDWYSIEIPPRMRALIVITYDAVDDQTYLYFYEKGMTPLSVANGEPIEIANPAYAEAAFLFRIYPLGDSFISDPTLGGGGLMNYTVSLYRIVSLYGS